MFSTIRERGGLAYQVTATSIEGVDPGFVAMYAATSPGREHRVVEAMLDEMGRIRREPPSAGELRRVKRHLVGTRAIGQQRAAARAASLSLGQLYGLGHDVEERYPGQIDAVTPDAVRRAARRYLDPGRMVVACVGPDAEQLRLI